MIITTKTLIFEKDAKETERKRGRQRQRNDNTNYTTALEPNNGKGI